MLIKTLSIQIVLYFGESDSDSNYTNCSQYKIQHLWICWLLIYYYNRHNILIDEATDCRITGHNGISCGENRRTCERISDLSWFYKHSETSGQWNQSRQRERLQGMFISQFVCSISSLSLLYLISLLLLLLLSILLCLPFPSAASSSFCLFIIICAIKNKSSKSTVQKSTLCNKCFKSFVLSREIDSCREWTNFWDVLSAGR